MKILSPITVFILASAGIHIGLVIHSYSTNITLPSSTGSVMSVNIKSHVSSPKKLSIKSKSKTKQVKTITKKLIQSIDNPAKSILSKTPPKIVKLLATTAVENTNTQSPSAEEKSKSRARIISIIHKALNQHFSYPRLAQRRNWQGKVLLSIRVTASGKIENIKLNQSSGYTILDKAAISSLTKVGELPQLVSLLPYDMNLTLPVIYQLTES